MILSNNIIYIIFTILKRVYLVDCEAGNGLAAKVMPATTININEWNNIKVLYKFVKFFVIISI